MRVGGHCDGRSRCQDQSQRQRHQTAAHHQGERRCKDGPQREGGEEVPDAQRAWIGELEDKEHQGGHGHGNDGLAPGGPADPSRPNQGDEHDCAGHQQDEDRSRHLDHQCGGPEPDIGTGPRNPEQEAWCAPRVVGCQELQALEVGLGNEERRVHHDGRIEHDVDGPHQRPGRHHDHDRLAPQAPTPLPRSDPGRQHDGQRQSTEQETGRLGRDRRPAGYPHPEEGPPIAAPQPAHHGPREQHRGQCERQIDPIEVAEAQYQRIE